MATTQTSAPTAVDDMDVHVSVELGRTNMTLDAALDLSEQSVMELDRYVGDKVDIRLNGRLYARGEVVTVGEHFGVRIVDLVEGESS